jgi:predicted kinase
MKPLLINVRGTCGSGKSTVVHQIRELVKTVPVYSIGRKRPVGYTGYTMQGLFIAGHYEIPMGGLDTFGTLDEAFEVIDRWGHSRHVLCEGKAQNRDVPYLLGRLHGFDVRCINLSTPAEECVQSVRNRVSAHRIRSELIERVYRKCQRDAVELAKGGVGVLNCDRETAVEAVRKWLDV